MFSIRRLTPLTSLVLLATTLAFPSVVSAADPPSWGWVTARHPSTTNYIPTAQNQGNSAGMSNSVHRNGVGRYSVTFAGVANSRGGHVEISALGPDPRYCDPIEWGGDLDEITVSINCYDFSGTLADSAFSVVFVSGGDVSGTMAYVWADQPTTTDYIPSLNYQFNSFGRLNRIHHGSYPGGYLVSFRGTDADHGNISISSLGNDSCLVGETSVDRGFVVGVRCINGNTQFDVLYTKHVGLTGVPRRKAAYLDAIMSHSASYTPAPDRRWSSAGLASTVQRTGAGKYVITLPGMARGGAAQVTAFGVSPVHICQLTSIRTDALPQKVGVRCSLTDGTPDDTRFTLSYTK